MTEEFSTSGGQRGGEMRHPNIDFDNPNFLIDDKIDDEGIIIDITKPSNRPKIINAGENKPVSSIEKLPVEIRGTWNLVFKTLETHPGFFIYGELEKLGFDKDIYPTINIGQSTLIFLSLRKWELGGEWLIKKIWLGKRHERPLKLSIFKHYEGFGDVLVSLFQLAERCHTFSNSSKLGTLIYDTPQKTLSAYFLEKKSSEIRNILRRPIYETKTACPNTLIGKTNLIKRSNQILKQLSNKENPYNPNNPYQINRYRLIEAAIQLIKQDFEAFESNYWKPYIQAERGWLKHQAKTCQDYWIEIDGEKGFRLCTRPQGKGGGKLVYPFATEI